MALLIGRFQPFHLGHVRAIEYALKRADMLVLVIGSAQRSHEYRNPFTAGERMEMIELVLRKKGLLESVIFAELPDVENHSLWVPLLKSLVPRFDMAFSNDALSIRLFKENGIHVEEVPLLRRDELQATEIRHRIASGKRWEHLVPREVSLYLNETKGAERIRELFAQLDAANNKI
ncbi:MAG TPA: nicotinamide-nucleotide adenylyltransferase [Conexivisphaerales archaeon]|nr:nicotinamide-nucleotide adenylyltransferase [Conexivisphaerales archaeon]